MSFKGIKGQDKAINLLQSILRNNRLASAYLFCGPEGVGKRMVANTLAKTINCQEASTDSCDKCASCLKIEKNQHPDFHYIGGLNNEDSAGGSAIKIEEVRQLQKEINLKPYEARKKVFIIDQAHHLTQEAANALLKVLEEPPQNSLIILITSQPEKLFKTIISRCQLIKFACLKREVLQQALIKDYSLDSSQAHFLAYFSEGRLGYALKLKESSLYKEKNALMDNYLAGPKSRQDYSLAPDKDNLRRDLNLLAVWLRDIYLIKTGIAHSELVNLDRKDQLLKVMHRYSFSELQDALNYLSQSLLYLEQNVNIKLLLACLKGFLKG